MLGDRAETAQAVAPLGDLHERQVPRRDPQPVGVCQRPRRARGKTASAARPDCRRPEPAAAARRQPLGRRADLVAGEDPHQLVDPRILLQQRLPVALGQAAGHDDAAGPPPPLQPQHFADDARRIPRGRRR